MIYERDDTRPYEHPHVGEVQVGKPDNESGFASVFVRLRVRFNPDERLAMTGFTDKAKRKRAPAHWAHGGMISDARPNSACGTKPKTW